jgi:hypothetical protein
MAGDAVKQTEAALAVLLLMASGAVSTGAALRGHWLVAALSLLLALLWWFLRQFELSGLPALGLTVFVFAAVLGVLADLPSWLMLLSVTAALAGWDLERFSRRLKMVSRLEDTTALQEAHRRRLAGVCVAGAAAGLLALNIQVQLSLLPTMVLALLLVFALGRIVRSGG